MNAYSKFMENSESLSSRVINQLCNIIPLLEDIHISDYFSSDFYIPKVMMLSKGRYSNHDDKKMANDIIKSLTKEKSTKKGFVLNPTNSRNLVPRGNSRSRRGSTIVMEDSEGSNKREKSGKIVKDLQTERKIVTIVQNHLHDYQSSVLVYKHTYIIIEELIDIEDEDNTLLHFHDQLRAILSTPPISLIDITHDDYYKIDRMDMIDYHGRLQEKFKVFVVEKYIER